MCVFNHSVVYDSLGPMDYSWPGSSVQGILQTRILEWVLEKEKATHSSILARRMTERLSTQQPFPATRDLPDPGIELGLLHCWWILYHLSYYTSIKKGKKNNEKTKWNNTKTKIPENSTSLFQSSTFAFPCQSCTWTGIGNFHFISPLFWASSFPISSMTEILCLQENNYLQHRPSQTISNKRRVCWKLVKKSHRIENQEIQLILTRKSLIFHTSFSWSPMIFPLLIFLSFEISLFFLQAGFLFLLLC